MSTNPLRPDTESEIVDEETTRILLERDATFEIDKEIATDARETLTSIRKDLKLPASR